VKWVFPDKVKMGMSTNEVFALRARISRDFMIGGSPYRTNVVSFIETESSLSPLVGYFYYFSGGRLGAVAKTYGHRGTGDGKLVRQNVYETITRSLIKLPDERVFRHIPPAPEPAWKTVELWLDRQSGNHLYFDEDEMLFRIIVFDPARFDRKDFFMDAETYRTKVAPLLEEAQKRVEAREEGIINRQEKRK